MIYLAISFLYYDTICTCETWLAVSVTISSLIPITDEDYARISSCTILKQISCTVVMFALEYCCCVFYYEL